MVPVGPVGPVTPNITGALPAMTSISAHGRIEPYPILVKLFCPTIHNEAETPVVVTLKINSQVPYAWETEPVALSAS
jgi:hypothetical protein